MIVVAGAKPKVEKFRASTTTHCYHCNNDSHWIVQKTGYFITLFFLPVLRFKTEYASFCPICGNAVVLTKEEFEQKIK